MKTVKLGVLAGLALALSGCEAVEAEITRLWQSDYDLPITWESPDVDIDVGKQVNKVEDQINQQKDADDAGRRNYAMLRALCETEPGRSCEPARFPKRIPRYLWPYGCIVAGGDAGAPQFLPKEQCTMALTCQPTDPASLEGGFNPSNPPAGNGCVEVGAWLEQVPGFSDMTDVAQAAKVDLSSKVGASVKDVRQVKKVTVNRVTLKFKENTFTYPVPATDTYIGEPVSDEAVKDAKALIAAGKVDIFGSLSQVPAEYVGNKNMSLNAEGKKKLSDALLGLKGTVAAEAHLEVPPETEADRADNCLDPAHPVTHATDYCESFPKPGDAQASPSYGKIKMSVEMEVVVRVNPSGTSS
jgi:hypothetical protein